VQLQRPLWASTSTKNPAYDELLYVDSLVAPNTVNTMPDPTLELYAIRGDAGKSQIADSKKREVLRQVINSLPDEGVSLEDITQKLEDDGVAAFMLSYDEVLETVASKLR
jgi:transaldolase